jgi:aspartate aminotransferase
MSFDALEPLTVDPVSRTYAALAMDPRVDKVDLGIGVYRDEAGGSPLMAAVREAQLRLATAAGPKTYLRPSGNIAYCRATEALVLGADHPVLTENRIVTVQTPGAGGGLRAVGEMVRVLAPKARVWASDPTWGPQLMGFAAAGCEIVRYPYFDRATNTLTFDAMLAALKGAREGDFVLLHGCCHNTTGEDLTPAQWDQLAVVLRDGGLTPIVDLVYQGLSEGLVEDVYGTRLLAATCPEMILITSASKAFGIYRDRTGTVSMIGREAGEVLANVERWLTRVVISLWFQPPDGGAAIVAEVLGDPVLTQAWRDELEAMRTRIVDLRRALHAELGFDFLLRQKGMFSLLPLDEAAVGRLAAEDGIYVMPDGRINVASLNQAILPRVATAIRRQLG